MATNSSQFSIDPRLFLMWGGISCVLLVLNLIGWVNPFYKSMDSIFNPFIIVTRNFAYNTDLLLTEVTHKSSVLKENIQLRRDIQNYEELAVINKNLQDQIDKLSSQTNITPESDKKFQLVKVIGIQNIFSINPEVLIHINDDIKIENNNVVYYEKNTLLGFVRDIRGNTVRIAAFYSPEVKFKIPVQNIKDSSQKGFIDNIQNGSVKIKNISKESKVNEGDIWITTNDVPEVPSNLIVGKVKTVINDPQEGFLEVELELPFNLSNTTYVLIEQ